jgi:5'-deoxynucleotidase YfbR-like HD superfamily hydrolase
VSEAVKEVMFGNMTRLKDTFRYSAQPVLKQESVAEHSFWTAMIGVCIALEIEPNSADLVALKSIVHDMEECMTGDLVRDMKYSSPHFREEIKKIETEFLRRLVSPMGDVGQTLFHVWETAKVGRTGQIVACADALSVIAYCTQEFELGNSNLYNIREGCTQLLIEKFGTDTELYPIVELALQESFGRWPDAR